MPEPTVLIYDPNDVNPYGSELALAVSRANYRVIHFKSALASNVGSEEVAVHPTLGGSFRARRTLGNALRRAWGPLLAGLRAGKGPLIAAWTRDPWDTMIIALRSCTIGRTIYVYHNPRKIRPRTGLAGRLERYALKHSHVVVHSQWLFDVARSDAPRLSVARHPPFALTVGGLSEPASGRAGNRVAFVGSLRADKGAEDLLEVAAASGGDWVLVVLSSDQLSPNLVSGLTALGVRVEQPPSRPGDSDIVRGIRSCQFVVAPYRAVTASGSILLSLASGAEVLSYRSPALLGLVDERNLVADARELGELMARFFADPWKSNNYSLAEELSVASEEWGRAIEGATRKWRR